MSFSRLDKILSHEGFGSRKAIRKILYSSEVFVNGNRILDPGFSVNPDKDEIKIDGETLTLRKNFYLMMNKPENFVSANKDGLHQTVFDLLDDRFHTPYLEENLHLVGRLDIDTEGLLLFTTDGAGADVLRCGADGKIRMDGFGVFRFVAGSRSVRRSSEGGPRGRASSRRWP